MIKPSRIGRFASGFMVWALSAGAACQAPAERTLTVATLNIAHGRGTALSRLALSRARLERSLDDIAALLRSAQPDVVALQEADVFSFGGKNLDHVARLAESCGYPYRHHGFHVDWGMKGARLRYGTALLSRLPLAAKTSEAFSLEPTDTKGFVAAEMVFRGRRLLVVSVHLDFKTAWTRKAQARKLAHHLSGFDLPCLVMGDFNCGSQDGDAVALLAERLNLRAYRAEADDLDTFPSQAPRARLDWILI